MLILTVTIVLLAVFAVLILIAGIKGFFVGAGEEVKRQHRVLKGHYETLRTKLEKKKQGKTSRTETDK